MNKILIFLGILGISFNSFSAEINLPKVSQTGMKNAETIIKGSTLRPLKISNGSDSSGASKKIYKFDGIFNQLEFSQNYILITWYQNDKASLDKAVRLGMASLGKDAGYFIHRVNLNGEHTDYSIQGHKIINSTCISKLCSIKIMK